MAGKKVKSKEKVLKPEGIVPEIKVPEVPKVEEKVPSGSLKCPRCASIVKETVKHKEMGDNCCPNCFYPFPKSK